MSPQRRAPRWLPPVALALLSALSFAGTLASDLVWDDRDLVELVRRAEGAGGLGGVAAAEYVFDDLAPKRIGVYRPLVLLSLWADGRVGGGRPAVYHATNVALHAVNALLVLALLRLLLPGRGAAWLGAALFAVHPVHAESVAFVSGRSDLFAAAGVLAGAVLWLRERQGLARRPVAGRVAGAAALALAALAKETAVALPAVLLLWEALAPHPEGGAAGRPRARRVAWWLLAWAAAIGALLLAREAAGIGVLRVLERKASGELVTPGADAGLLLGVVLTYLRLLLAPFPPNPWYTPAAVQPTAAAIAAALALAGLCRLASRPAAGRAGALAPIWFALFLAPPVAVRLGVVLAERHLYLPSVALALLAGGLAGMIGAAGGGRGAGSAAATRARALRAAAGLLLAAGCAGCWGNGRIWQSNLTLYRQMTLVSPDAPIGHKNYGAELSLAGRQREAVASYQRALALSPRDVELHYNLGIAWEGLGETRRAIESYGEALRLKPGLIDARVRLWQLSKRR